MASALKAQTPHQFCGTPDGRSEWLKKYQQRPAHLKSNDDEEIWVPIQIHNVGTDSGGGYYNINSIYRDFCDLQEQFLQSNIHLYLTDEINYVNSSQLYYHSSFNEGYEVMDEIDYPDIINVYISQEAAGNCGYAAYWINRVVLAHNCIGPGSSTWAHEMGHVFSLPHTFNNNNMSSNEDFTEPAPNDFERVDGSNCANAGDGFCDTPPDYLGFRWTCNGDGVSGRVQTDPDGEKFQSDGQYFMSYANDGCMDKFSDEQIGSMRDFIREERSVYLTEEAAFLPIEATTLTNTIPVDGGYMQKEGGHSIVWDEIENVDEYIIEISRFSIFNFVEFGGSTKRNFFGFSGNLIDGQTYYWRVRPVNRAHLCHDYLPIQSFTVVDGAISTAVTPLFEKGEITVFPNPASDQEQVSLYFEMAKAETLQLEVVNLLGKKVYQTSFNTQIGTNQEQIATGALSRGVYYLILRNQTSSWQSKLVIQ